MMLSAVDGWHDYMRSRDRHALFDLLHPDAVFESPVVHTPQRGREIVFKYLVSADHVLGGTSFRYTGEWRNERGAVLEFVSEVEGLTINGVDMIRATEDGARIENFKVMVRPLKAIQMVHGLMAKALQTA